MAIELIILDRPDIPEDERIWILPEQKRVVIGRLEMKEGSDFTVRNRAISRKHCEIIHSGNSYVIRDFSKFGTFINNERVIGEATLENEQRLSLSRLEDEPEIKYVVEYIVRIR